MQKVRRRGLRIATASDIVVHTKQASPRTALILHRQDGEYTVLHSKPHVFSGKGQAIDPLRVLLIPGPGIAGQHAHKSRPLLLIQSRQQLNTWAI